MTKTFYILDGNSLLYRAYYAIPSLSNSRGEPTNAVYGFTNTIFKLLHSREINYLACAFDSPGPTLRHEKFSAYKIHRKGMPEELVRQLPAVKEVLGAMGIAIFEKEGYEADDILATLTEKGRSEGCRVYIITGDKDAFQLVNEDVLVLQPGKEEKEITPEKVREMLEVNPSQVPDLIGLMGDSSDGLPGVPGIGPKTAARLLSRFGSIEELYRNLASLDHKALREKLSQYKEACYQSRDLAVLDRDVPLEIDWPKCRLQFPSPRFAALSPELIKLFRRLGFTSLVKRLLPPDPADSKSDYDLTGSGGLKDKKDLKELIALAKKKKELLIYLEKKKEELILALDEAHIFLLARPFLPEIKELLSDKDIRKIGHGFKDMLRCLWSEGLILEGIYFDVEIASYLLNSERPSHDLNGLSLDYFGRNLKGGYTGMVKTIFTLKERMTEELKETEQAELFYEVEMKLVSILAGMEEEGIRVNQNKLKRLSKDLAEELSIKEERIFALAGERFNLNSSQQLGRILFQKMGLPPQKKIKTGFSTDVEVLETLAPLYPIAFEVLNRRELYKLKSTYVDGLLKLINPKTKRLHTTFNQTITSTGRLSSSNPNLQNIPIRGERGKSLRTVFEAGPGKLLLSADYSQIELRILAHLSADKALLEAFQRDEDIHASTARHIFKLEGEVSEELRRRAKTVNFGIIYGITAYGLGKELGITPEEAQNYIDQYMAQYPSVKNYLTSLVKEARTRGFSCTMLGRRRPLSADLERLAINTPIQGSGADIIKLAMVKVDQELKKKNLAVVLILQVHDELLFELPEKELEETRELIRPIMEKAFTLSVPLKVNISWGKTWADFKKEGNDHEEKSRRCSDSANQSGCVWPRL